jgi:glycosyltransferase involved in cell wall biosynthesis
MLEGRDIICFAHDWDSDPTSKTHIMRILSTKNRILWVNSIGMRRPGASRRDLTRLLVKLKRGLRGRVRVHDSFHVFNALALPFPGVRGIERLNTSLMSVAIRRGARRLGFRRPILWTFMPNVGGLVGRLGEGTVVYHCVDEYSAFAGVAAQSLRAMERELVQKADLVFTSSEQLCQERRPHNPRSFFVSHGVDVQHFSRALDPDTPVAPDLQGLPRPIVGFFGLLAEWIDLSLIRDLAEKRPDWSIVLIGKATADVGQLNHLPNVRLLGPRPYASLPGYCKGFDVGIIPFRINELTVRANPLKLREYLAAGVPVVSTDMPEIRRYEAVRIAADAGGFVREIESALEERGDAPRRHRAETMWAESWEARVEQLSEIIQSFERERENGRIPPAYGFVAGGRRSVVTLRRDGRPGERVPPR